MTAAAVLLMSCTACGAARVVRLDTGQGSPLEYRSPTSSQPVEMETGAFEEALARLVLNTPLTLHPPERGWLVPASYPGSGAQGRWWHLMAKGHTGLCKAGQRRGATCLSLLDDVLDLTSWDKLGVALVLALDPLKASISKAVEKTLAPQLFHGIIAAGLVTWVVLAANPEPAFTKAAAIVSVLMLAYLGIEIFLDVVQASRELKRATDGATTVEELAQAAQHFASRVGPRVTQVFVLAVTLAAGFARATAGASGLGINLVNVGQVSSVVVVGSTLVISLPATAVAMSAAGSGSGSGRGANRLRPDPAAQGPHSTFKRHPKTGKVTSHSEWQPSSNNPSGHDQAKRVDATGDPHFNKATGQDVATPHVHEKVVPGGVRPARPDEVPQ